MTAKRQSVEQFTGLCSAAVSEMIDGKPTLLLDFIIPLEEMPTEMRDIVKWMFMHQQLRITVQPAKSV